MVKKQASQSTAIAKIETRDQISSGGVAFRLQQDANPEIAIVSVKPSLRWQLPKGIVDPGESSDVTAVREVREEVGVQLERWNLFRVYHCTRGDVYPASGCHAWTIMRPPRGRVKVGGR